MNKYENIRLNFFNTYSKNLELVADSLQIQMGYTDANGNFVQLKNNYICPICSNSFIYDSLDQQSSNPLSLEDVPPKALGGRPLILTCKSCNNKVGGINLDAELIKYIKDEPYFKHEQNSHVDYYYEINKKVTAKGRMTIVGNKKQITFYTTHPLLENELKNNFGDKSQIKFTYRVPNQRKVLLALLRIAHLKMFHFFGYGYFFQPSIEIIQKQLFSPNQDILPKFGIPSFHSLSGGDTGIYFIKSPLNLCAYIVVFDVFISNRRSTYSVLIPGPYSECIEMYSKLEESQEISLDVLPIKKDNYLSDSNFIFAYKDFWDYNLENSK